MNKGLKIRKLIKFIVIWVRISDFLCVEKYFHAKNAKDEESESKKMEKFNYDRHDFHKSCKDSYDIIDDLII